MGNRGRPPLLSDDVILDHALAAFAASGYEAMSVRALNAELGLSHETISKRFGPKVELFRVALCHGVARLVTDLDHELGADTSAGDLARLRSFVRAFMVVSSRHPTLGELLHNDGIGEQERSLLFGGSGLGERLGEVIALLDRLHTAGVIRRTEIRDLWFLAQGAVAPLRFHELSKMFDQFDGPVVADELILRMTDALMRTMRVDPDTADSAH